MLRFFARTGSPRAGYLPHGFANLTFAMEEGACRVRL
jgi:hypothetical protein